MYVFKVSDHQYDLICVNSSLCQMAERDSDINMLISLRGSMNCTNKPPGSFQMYVFLMQKQTFFQQFVFKVN